MSDIESEQDEGFSNNLKKLLAIQNSNNGEVNKKTTAPSHPSTKKMVDTAIKSLNERNGSSLQAIKKFIATNYNADSQKMALYIRKYLKKSVESGQMIQTKGKGASGSFKLSAASQELKKPKPKLNNEKEKPISAINKRKLMNLADAVHDAVDSQSPKKSASKLNKPIEKEKIDKTKSKKISKKLKTVEIKTATEQKKISAAEAGKLKTSKTKKLTVKVSAVPAIKIKEAKKTVKLTKK